MKKISEFTHIEEENLSIGKNIPHQYLWKYWDPAEIHIKKAKSKKGKKKGKDAKFLTKDVIDLRQFPFGLKEGDVIGFRDNTVHPDLIQDDDF